MPQITAFIVPAESKRDVIKELNTIGVDEFSLFPELDKIANYLRRKNGI